MKKVNSNWCTFLVFTIQLTAFIPFGINLTMFNPSTPAIKEFVNETYIQRYNASATEDDLQVAIALCQSFIIVGTAIGCLMVRPVLKYFSRRTNLILAQLISVFASILMSPVAKFGQAYEAIVVGRLISGIARGILFTLVPLYIAEIVSRKTLAVYLSSSGAFLHMGSALGNALAHPAVLGGVSTWPYLLAVPAVFAVALLCVIPWFPQTPTYLMLQNKNVESFSEIKLLKSEAYELLRSLRSGSPDEITDEYGQLCQELDDDAKIKKATLLEVVSTKRYRKQLLGAALVQLSAQFAGMQAVLQYTNTVFKVSGVDFNQATFYTIVLFVILGSTCFLSRFFIHRYGSKKMLVSGLVIIAFSLILLTIAAELKSSATVALSIVALVLYFIGSGCGPIATLFSLPSEITTQQSRPIILWLSGLSFWLFGTAVVFLAPFLLNWIGGYTYLIFIAMVLLNIVYVCVFIPDTRKKTVAEIQSMLDRKSELKSDNTSASLLTSTA